jgi:hypothetical protein
MESLARDLEQPRQRGSRRLRNFLAFELTASGGRARSTPTRSFVVKQRRNGVTITQLHPVRRVITVRIVAWLLVAVALYDGSGLTFGGDSFTGSETYAALRLVPGGMRTWGVLLLAGAVAVAWGIGKESFGNYRTLNVVLAIGFGYYLLWALVIPATWVYVETIPAWGAESKYLLIASLYYICARSVAPRREAGSTSKK